MHRFVRVYLIPGAVFQSVVIGGGYGTGREVVEYFTRFGVPGGLMAMGVTLVCWTIVLGLTYDFARTFAVYDYRTFFKALLGRAWWLYEGLYVVMLVLVLAVVASAAGEIIETRYGLPYGVGLGVMLACIGLLVFYGRTAITRVLAAWSVFLYAVFLVYFLLAFSQLGTAISAAMTSGPVAPGWALSGFKYAMYNVAIVPAILFAVRDVRTRREAYGSGFFSALLCLVPALLFHVSFGGAYPDILEAVLPTYAMIDRLGAEALLLAYVVMLFGTFIETGAGFLQGINERLDAHRAERGLPPLQPALRAAIGIAGILLSALLATAGIVALIAEGYGLISWAFFAVYVLPILTLGVLRLHRHHRQHQG